MQQKYLFMSDGRNAKVRVIDRQSLDELYNFGGVGSVKDMGVGWPTATR